METKEKTLLIQDNRMIWRILHGCKIAPSGNITASKTLKQHDEVLLFLL